MGSDSSWMHLANLGIGYRSVAYHTKHEAWSRLEAPFRPEHFSKNLYLSMWYPLVRYCGGDASPIRRVSTASGYESDSSECPTPSPAGAHFRGLPEGILACGRAKT